MLPSGWPHTLRVMDHTLAVDADRRDQDLRAACAPWTTSPCRSAAGEVYGVLGPNGAGKTTFLRMLFGLIRPDAGTIRVFGRTWDEPGVGVLDGVAGFIESPKFYPYLTGRQNLEGLALLDGGVRPGLLEEVLDIVDLTDRADDKVGGYSYGMRQRLGVAASLLREPRLLVLDEPANGLDPAGIRDMRALVKRLAGSGPDGAAQLPPHGRGRGDLRQRHHHEPGSVAFHGTIAAAAHDGSRPRLPARHHRRRARARPRRSHPAVTVDPRPRRAGAGRHRTAALVSAYVAALVRADIELLGFTPTQTPLEALFFMLTDEPDTRTGRAPRRSAMTAVQTRTGRPGRTTLPVARRAGLGAALRWEIRKLRAQYRAWAVLVGAVLAPIPIVVIIHGQSRPPKDTLFGRFATENGFALALLVLGFAAQWVLPLLTADRRR